MAHSSDSMTIGATLSSGDQLDRPGAGRRPGGRRYPQPASGQSYTVLVSGVNGTTGVASVEVYALGDASSGLLAPKKFRNISTRGNVGTGDNVLIGGTIIQGSAAQRVIVRAIGPDLAGAGVPGPLQDPTLELRDAEGTLLLANDDWRSNQEQEIIASGLAPQDNRDSAILTTLLPTSYTAIVREKATAPDCPGRNLQSRLVSARFLASLLIEIRLGKKLIADHAAVFEGDGAFGIAQDGNAIVKKRIKNGS